jgi:alcohol dehydrogenase class IV
MAQALGGRYGLPHGAMNALTLPQALAFNAEVAPDAVARFRQETSVPVEELAALGDFGRLRDWGIPEEDLPELAAATVERAGAKANPRVASVAEVEQLLHNIY